MSDSKNKTNPGSAVSAEVDRRAALRRLGRFAAVTPPAVALLLAARSRPANAQPISLNDSGADNTNQ